MTALHDVEDDALPPAPAGGIAYEFVETPDGFSLRFRVATTTSSTVHGTILLLQGRNESIEKYAETIADLNDAGFDVATFDWRGQGASSRFFSNREPGYVESFDQYATDLETIFGDVVLPDCRPPFFVIAHSTGALVTLYCAPAMVNRVRRIVLSAPFLGLPASTAKLTAARIVSRLMCFLGLGNVYVAGGSARKMLKPFEINPLTADPDRYARNISIVNKNPGLALGGPTAAWTAAIFDAIDRISDPSHMTATVVPTLVVMAGRDKVVSNARIEAYTRKLRSASLITIDGARHELMQEADIYREQFFAAVKAFIPGSGD